MKGAGDPAAPAAGGAGGAPLWLVLGVVVVAYAGGASLAFLGFGAPSIVVLFLPAGVTVSALVLNDRRRWPWILAAVAVTEVVVDVSHGMSPRWVWGFALANTAEPLVGALLLRRLVPGEVNLLRRRDLVVFLGACVGAGPLVGGMIGATMLAAGLDLPWLQSFVSFWAGDATGVLTVGGCVLAWRYSAGRRPSVARAGMAVAACAAATVVGFWPQFVPLFYLPIPVLFWLAFSQRLNVVLTGGMAMTVAANLMTGTGHGPWAGLETSDQLRTLTLQLFLSTTILGAWAVAVGVAERDRARRDTSVERAARQRLTALQILTADLAKAATSDAIAEAIVREGISIVADHGSAAIVTTDGAGLKVWQTPDRTDTSPARPHRVSLDADTPHVEVVRTGTRLVHQRQADLVAAFPHLAPVYRDLDIRSSICVPIPAGRSAPLGSLAFSFCRDGAVDADVIAFAEALAGLSGQALQRSRSYERELDAAHQLQTALLPVVTGGLSGIQVGATYRPADRTHQVGGDWYDVFPLPEGRIGFAVGDVVGHHLAAAAAMARLQSALRIIAQTADGPAQVLDDLDRASALIADSTMTTIGFADYTPATRLLRYACAGHPPPLLIADNEAEYLWEGRSLPLGLSQKQRRHSERIVPDGATLVWYTDGLVEREGQHIATNMDRLADIARAAATTDAPTLAMELLTRLAGDEALNDDTVVLCISFTGTAGPAMLTAAAQIRLAADPSGSNAVTAGPSGGKAVAAGPSGTEQAD